MLLRFVEKPIPLQTLTEELSSESCKKATSECAAMISKRGFSAHLSGEAYSGGSPLAADPQDVDGILKGMSPKFATPYSEVVDCNRALLESLPLRVFYSVRSERVLKMVEMRRRVKLRAIDKDGWRFTFSGAAYNLADCEA